MKSGFLAGTVEEERKCPRMEVDQLAEIADVTARVRGATKGLEGEAYQRALRGEMARIEKECQTSDALRCDVVTLYHGGLYHLYTYRRFQDVRLVFAPELAIAFFGGDPDNFMFPFAKDPERAARVLPAFVAIEKAQARLREVRKELHALEHGVEGEVFSIARTLLRAAEERPRPNELRLREFRDSNLPVLTQRIFGEAPIYPELEKLLLGHALAKVREMLGPDHPAVKRLLGKESPEEVAARAVDGTKLRDVAVRRRLWEGGKQAVDGSDDPMIALARVVDPDARAVRKTWEDEIDSVVKKSQEAIAEARFAVQGRTTYPDATFTLRLSYGQVKGWKAGEAAREVVEAGGEGQAVRRYASRGTAIIRSSARRAPAATSAGTWISCFPRLSASRIMTRSTIFMYGQCMRQPMQPSATMNSLSGKRFFIW